MVRLPCTPRPLLWMLLLLLWRVDSFSSNRRSFGGVVWSPASSRRSATATTTTMKWQAISSSVVVDASPDEAYGLYTQLERFPEWSPWLRNVEYDPDRASGSTKWVLASRGVTVAWTAKQVADEPGKRIAWEATSGLPNKGEVTFQSLPGGSSDAAGGISSSGGGGGRSSSSKGEDGGTEVRLEISYDAPSFITVLVKNISVLSRFIEKTLFKDLKRFKIVLEEEMEERRREEEANEAWERGEKW